LWRGGIVRGLAASTKMLHTAAVDAKMPGGSTSTVQEALRMPQDLVELFAAVERLEQVLRTNARKLDELGKKVDRIDHEVSNLAADMRSLRR
jgi:hypothetical protein